MKRNTPEKENKRGKLSNREDKSSTGPGLGLGAAVPGALFGTIYAAGAQSMGNFVSAIEPAHRDAAPIAKGDFDSMKYEDAFQEARAQVGPGGLFAWHGNVHSTYTQDEWDSLSEARQEEFEDLMANARIDVPGYDAPPSQTLLARTEVRVEVVADEEDGKVADLSGDDDSIPELHPTLIAQAEESEELPVEEEEDPFMPETASDVDPSGLEDDPSLEDDLFGDEDTMDFGADLF